MFTRYLDEEMDLASGDRDTRGGTDARDGLPHMPHPGSYYGLPGNPYTTLIR
jgi:hypothetical protein